MPTVGKVFGGKVLGIDLKGVRVKVKTFDETVVLGVITTGNLAGKQYQVDGIARVEVIGVRQLANGLQVLDLKPAPKKK